MPLEISERETLTSSTRELLQTLLRQLSRGLVLDVTRLSQLATALHRAHTEIYREMQIQDIKDLPPPINTSTANAMGESGSTSFSVGDQLGGAPLQQENSTVKAGHGFEWITRHLTAMHKMYIKPETNSSQFHYIPWDNLSICHSYHDLLSAYMQVVLYKPESAEVNFKKGLVRPLPAPGQDGVPPEQN